MRLDDDLRYFETQEFQEILAKYEAARQSGSSLYMDADDLTDVAEYYAMVRNDDELAGEAIDLALQLHPDAVDPLIFQARQLMLNGEDEAALQACEAIPDQQHREVFFLRAELMVRDGRADDARTYLLECAEGLTEDLDYFLYDSAYIFIDYHDTSNARAFAEELEPMAPKWFKTWELMADICLSEDKNEEALKYIEQMLDKDPFYLAAWNWRAEAYCGLQDLEKALESTDFALAVEPQNERAIELKAWVLLRLGNLDDAHELYVELQQMNPESEIHCLYDSFCLFDKEQYAEALQLIEKAEALAEGLSPEQPAIYEHHAHILSILNRPEEALKYIDLAEEAAQAEDAKSEDRLQDFDYYRARIYADNGDSETALKYIKQIMDKEQEAVDAVVLQGAQILFEAGDYETAESLFSQLMKVLPDGPRKAPVYPYLAACCHELGKTLSCLQNIRLAIDNHSPEMKDILGYLFPEAVQPAEYFDYYYYQVYGTWPSEPSA